MDNFVSGGSNVGGTSAAVPGGPVIVQSFPGVVTAATSGAPGSVHHNSANAPTAMNVNEWYYDHLPAILTGVAAAGSDKLIPGLGVGRRRILLNPNCLRFMLTQAQQQTCLFPRPLNFLRRKTVTS